MLVHGPPLFQLTLLQTAPCMKMKLQTKVVSTQTHKEMKENSQFGSDYWIIQSFLYIYSPQRMKRDVFSDPPSFPLAPPNHCKANDIPIIPSWKLMNANILN